LQPEWAWPDQDYSRTRSFGHGKLLSAYETYRTSLEQALFWGDVMHHPLQFVRPDWNSVFCEFPEAARKSRHRVMNHAAETNALVFTTHFAGSSAGRVSREDDQLTWHFD
jgi:hypothetical protein